MTAGRLTNTKENFRKLIFGGVAATLVMAGALTRDASATEAAQTDIDDPFGLPTVMSDDPWSATWRDLQSQIQSEKRIIAQCRAEPHSCPLPAALRFIELVKEGDQYEGLVRIGHINRAVNFAITSVNSAAVQTTWTSPLSILAAGFWTIVP